MAEKARTRTSISATAPTTAPNPKLSSATTFCYRQFKFGKRISRTDKVFD